MDKRIIKEKILSKKPILKKTTTDLQTSILLMKQKQKLEIEKIKKGLNQNHKKIISEYASRLKNETESTKKNSLDFIKKIDSLNGLLQTKTTIEETLRAELKKLNAEKTAYLKKLEVTSTFNSKVEDLLNEKKILKS